MDAYFHAFLWPADDTKLSDNLPPTTSPFEAWSTVDNLLGVVLVS